MTREAGSIPTMCICPTPSVLSILTVVWISVKLLPCLLCTLFAAGSCATLFTVVLAPFSSPRSKRYPYPCYYRYTCNSVSLIQHLTGGLSTNSLILSESHVFHCGIFIFQLLNCPGPLGIYPGSSSRTDHRNPPIPLN